MTETRVGFLYNAACSLLRMESNTTQTLLRSYYLMRCSDVSKDAALPQQYFSSKLRCSHCYIDWQKGTQTTIKKRKLSKQQKRRLRQNALNNKDPKSKRELTCDKVLEKICTFCKHKTLTPLGKIERQKKSATTSVAKENKSSKEKVGKIMKTSKVPSLPVKTSETNVYTSAKDIFSLKNNDNILTSLIQKPAKIIKNNKKKKDKFAGLCQQAVLASAKLKEEQKKLNKLNLFLKPSS